MKIQALLFIPLVYMHAINLVILYEKTGLQEVKEMYYYVIDKLLEKFNEHLQRRGLRIGLLNLLAYDDYLSKPEYRELAIRGGEDTFDGRIDALKDIPTNVILVASASPEEEREKYIFNSPCTSRFISNMVTREVVDEELLTKIIYAVFGWMENMFKTTVPNPVKERNPEVFDRFAKEATNPEFIEKLKQCSREIRGKFETFVRKVEWGGREPMLKELLDDEDFGKETNVEISSPLKWVMQKQESDETNPPTREKQSKKKRIEPSSEEECSSDREKEPRKKRRKAERLNENKSKVKENEATKEKESDEDDAEQGSAKRNNEKYKTGQLTSPRENDQREIEMKIREELQRLLGRGSNEIGGNDFSPSTERKTGIERSIQQLSPAFSTQTAAPSKSNLRVIDSLSYGRLPYKRNQMR